MYPGEATGLLRLHSTYRQDLKIYSSDEGRVQMSAAALAKGLTDHEHLSWLVRLNTLVINLSCAGEISLISSCVRQARLHEIIASARKTSDGSELPEKAWMVDGATNTTSYISINMVCQYETSDCSPFAGNNSN